MECNMDHWANHVFINLDYWRELHADQDWCLNQYLIKIKLPIESMVNTTIYCWDYIGLNLEKIRNNWQVTDVNFFRKLINEDSILWLLWLERGNLGDGKPFYK